MDGATSMNEPTPEADGGAGARGRKIGALFTNLQAAVITRGGERTWLYPNAIELRKHQPDGRLIDDPPNLEAIMASLNPPAVHWVRGYGPTGYGWRVFALRLACAWHEYEISDWGASLTPEDPDRPGISVPGALILWRDGTTLELAFADSHRPLDVTDITAEPASPPNLGIVMRRKIAKYWYGGHIPEITYVNVDQRRAEQ
jgi:hypothetical protein